MGFIGKFVGGTFGFMLGGPLGAIAGMVFGHAFDKSGQVGTSPNSSAFQDKTKLTFFVGCFSMLGKLVKADGTVSTAELKSVEQFMTQDLRLDPASKNIANNIFNTALNSSDRFEDYALQFYQEFRTQPQFLEMIIDILYKVAAADSNVSKEETILIESAVKIFNLNQTLFENLRSKYIKTESRYYSVLDCKNTDSDDQIKKQYRKMVSDYHPDKIASKGLPEDFTKFANDKFRGIQEAYEAIKTERGFS